jgi:uncharacterized RDD family membrane protein YckC
MEMCQTGFQRVVAAVVDNIILQLCMLPLVWVLRSNLSTAINLIFAVLACIIPVSYSIYMHGRFGQTLGKFFSGVKVVNFTGGRISYQQALMRDIVPCIILPVWIWTVAYVSVYREYPPSVMFKWAENIAIYWGVLELITMLFNEQRRAIHDYIAKTVVIRVNRPF